MKSTENRPFHLVLCPGNAISYSSLMKSDDIRQCSSFNNFSARNMPSYNLFVILACLFLSRCLGFVEVATVCRSPKSTMTIHLSLKPAAPALMDSGKALARSGELLIELTSALDIYGGGLSAAGAQIRNSGDCVAQAAASCRFKTAAELVCDELREGATCLTEATAKLKLAAEEAYADDDSNLAKVIGKISAQPNKPLPSTLANGRLCFTHGNQKTWQTR